MHSLKISVLTLHLILCAQEKSGGKIIYRIGGVVYLFRGRNYDHRRRPQFPVMLWKPATPVYPKLIQDAPEGLTEEEADELRTKGKTLLPICKLGRFATIFFCLVCFDIILIIDGFV